MLKQWKAEFLWASLNINAYYFIIPFCLWINVNPIRTNRIELVLILPDCLDSFDSVQNCAYKTCLFFHYAWFQMRESWQETVDKQVCGCLTWRLAVQSCFVHVQNDIWLNRAARFVFQNAPSFQKLFHDKDSGVTFTFLSSTQVCFFILSIDFYSFFNQQWEPKVLLPPEM